MIRVTIHRSPNGAYLGFESEGHADYASFGKDIVCAAASVLMINTINSIELYTPTVEDYKSRDDGGYLTVVFPTGTEEKAKLLLDSMVSGLKQIEMRYGKEHLSVEFKEE